jgi:hypothetical protein
VRVYERAVESQGPALTTDGSEETNLAARRGLATSRGPAARRRSWHNRGTMSRRSRTQPRFMLSIPLGNLIQLGGLFGALGLVARAARARPPWGGRMLTAGWLVTYFCNHAIGHWAVGRLVGIRFLGYGVHGTTAPGWYPPGMRWIFRHVPFFSALSDPASRRAAHPLARMAMTSVARCLRGLRVLASPSTDAPRGFQGPGLC